jgi:hypothetical protein
MGAEPKTPVISAACLSAVQHKAERAMAREILRSEPDLEAVEILAYAATLTAYFVELFEQRESSQGDAPNANT